MSSDDAGEQIAEFVRTHPDADGADTTAPEPSPLGRVARDRREHAHRARTRPPRRPRGERMTLNDFAAPECQLRDCDAEAEVSRDHPEFGTVQVCQTCASLLGGDADQ